MKLGDRLLRSRGCDHPFIWLWIYERIRLDEVLIQFPRIQVDWVEGWDQLVVHIVRRLAHLHSLPWDRRILDQSHFLHKLCVSALLAHRCSVGSLVGELFDDCIGVRCVLQSILDMIKLPSSVLSRVENRVFTEREGAVLLRLNCRQVLLWLLLLFLDLSTHESNKVKGCLRVHQFVFVLIEFEINKF